MRRAQRDERLWQLRQARLFLSLLASVIICTRDRANNLAELLHRLPKQVVSASTRWEIIVVDNASTDHTQQVLSDAIGTSTIPLRALSEPELGLSAARNRGWRAAAGDLVAFLDDDSVPEPGWLQALIESFDAPAVEATPVTADAPDAFAGAGEIAAEEPTPEG